MPFSLFQFSPVASCLIVGYHWEESDFLFFTFCVLGSISYFCTLVRTPWGFSSPGSTILALSASPQRKAHLPQPANSTVPNTIQMLLAFFAAKAHCWFMITFVSPMSAGSFSTKLLSNRLVPGIFWSMGIFLPGCRIWHLPLLNMRKFLFACFSSLLRSLWMVAAQPPGVSSTRQSCIICKLVECTLCSIIRVINEDVKQHRPHCQPMGCTTSDWPPAGLRATDRKPLGLGLQPFFNLAVHLSGLSACL